MLKSNAKGNYLKKFQKEEKEELEVAENFQFFCRKISIISKAYPSIDL